MTFTEDDLKKGKTLHRELREALEARRTRRASGCSGGDKWPYREKKDEVRSFWLRHGEDALAALEEAWGKLRRIQDMCDLVIEANWPLDMIRLRFEQVQKILRATEEGP